MSTLFLRRPSRRAIASMEYRQATDYLLESISMILEMGLNRLFSVSPAVNYVTLRYMSVIHFS